MSEKENNKKRRRSPALVAGLVLLFLAIVILMTLAMFASFDEVTNVFEAGKVDIVLTESKWDPKDGDKVVPNDFIDKNPAIVNKEETVDTYVFMKVTVPYDDDKALQIERAHQDDQTQSGTQSGKVIYTNTDGLKIPVFEFVTTGEKSDGTGAGIKVYNQAFIASPSEENARLQPINPGWYLIEDYKEDDPVNKTYTYLYAHVKPGTETSGTPELMPLIHGATTEYPLFNEIYYNNIRERELQYKVDEQGHYVLDGNENKIVAVTPFPDPARNYSIRIEAYGIQANFLKPNNTTTMIPEEVWPYIDKSYTYDSTTGHMTKANNP